MLPPVNLKKKKNPTLNICYTQLCSQWRFQKYQHQKLCHYDKKIVNNNLLQNIVDKILNKSIV